MNYFIYFTLCQYFCLCAIQKLKIHLIAHYSNARSLWKDRPALRCHVQNMSNASVLRQAVMSHCYRRVFRLNFIVTVELYYWTIKREVILSNVKQKCRPLPSGSAVNLNRLNLIETELFIKMRYEVWSSPTMKQTNLRAGCNSALQPGTMTGRRSETFEELLYLFSSEDKYKGFSLY